MRAQPSSARPAALSHQVLNAGLRRSERRCCGGGRIDAVVECRQLRPCVGGALEQLVVARGAEPALRLGDPVEPGLDLVATARLRLERAEEGVQVGRRLAKPQLGVAQLVARLLQLRCQPLERRHCPLGDPDEPCGAVALLGRERLGGGRGGLREVRDVPQALPLVAEAVLVARLEALGVLHERAQLGEAGFGERGAGRQLLVATARGEQVAPRRACVGRGGGAAPRRRSGRAPRAGTPAARAAAARTAPTSRARARRWRRRPPARRPGPRRRHGCGRRRRRGARRAARPRPPGAARRARRAPREGSSSASTYASSPAGPTNESSPFVPSSRPTAWARIVFPAPVSPVIAFRPGESSSSASRISTRFSIRRRRSIADHRREGTRRRTLSFSALRLVAALCARRGRVITRPLSMCTHAHAAGARVHSQRGAGVPRPLAALRRRRSRGTG